MKYQILENRQLNENFWLMKTDCSDQPGPGQFYMLRSWDRYPLLSRPISVFDADEHSASFLYKVVGEGTELFTKLEKGDSITLSRPLGNGFPEVSGKVAMVGGGVGIAPLYLTAKKLFRKADTSVDLFLGFSGTPVMEKEYEAVSDHLDVKLGGYITDDINPESYDVILACGPMVMMKALYQKCQKYGKADAVYVSMESRMGCGIGVCLGCSIETASGMKRVCKDGPVFMGSEVFCHE
ncbi:MAG: dihydroorotate dehydrogenase electron transfer subunit [Bulleidia sp.]